MQISRVRRWAAPLGALVVLSASASALATSSPPAGSVHQAFGKAGCYTDGGASEAGPHTCRNVRGANGATTVAISPDGRFAYVDGYGGNNTTAPPALAVLKRDPKTGTLSQLPGKSGCFSRDGSSTAGPGTCTKARDLDSGDATSVVISSDGRFLYVASQYSTGPPTTDVGGIAVFARNLKTGTLRQLSGKAGCVVAVAYKNCALAREVDEISNVHITPDQKYLYASDYVSSPHAGIAIFKRNAKNGTLRQLPSSDGCLSVNGTTTQSGTKKVCGRAPNISKPWDVATPDNRFVYIPASYGPRLVQVYERDAKGGLVPLVGKGACISDSGTSPGGPCAKGHGLSNPERAVPSANGNFLYVASYETPSPIVVLNRNPKTGLLRERSGPAACISVDGTTGGKTGTCRTGTALDGEYAGALSPDGRTLYFSEDGIGPSATSGLTVFRVSPKKGGFTQLSGKYGCVTPDGSSEKGPGTCQKGRAIAGAYQVALAAGGSDVYVASYSDNGVALFYAHK